MGTLETGKTTLLRLIGLQLIHNHSMVLFNDKNITTL